MSHRSDFSQQRQLVGAGAVGMPVARVDREPAQLRVGRQRILIRRHAPVELPPNILGNFGDHAGAAFALQLLEEVTHAHDDPARQKAPLNPRSAATEILDHALNADSQVVRIRELRTAPGGLAPCERIQNWIHESRGNDLIIKFIHHMQIVARGNDKGKS